MLSVKLFGSGQAQIDEHPLAGFPHQYAYLVLCFLLLNKPHPQTREKLASQFWGGLPNPSARKCLRNALWRLRLSFQNAGEALEKYVFIYEDCISYINKDDTWVDIDIFEKTVNLYLETPDHQITPEGIEDLESATRLYIGDLLEGCYDDWCLYDRERLRLLYIHALHKMMRYYTHCRQISRALVTGERLLALDCTQEKVHYQMMWLYWRQGDRSAAIAQYKSCFEILHEELGIPPMQDTRLLYENVISGQPLRRINSPLSNQVSDKRQAGSHQKPSPDNKNSDIITQTLQKLQRLQDKIEETHNELLQLEKIIHEVLANPGRS